MPYDAIVRIYQGRPVTREAITHGERLEAILGDSPKVVGSTVFGGGPSVSVEDLKLVGDALVEAELVNKVVGISDISDRGKRTPATTYVPPQSYSTVHLEVIPPIRDDPTAVAEVIGAVLGTRFNDGVGIIDNRYVDPVSANGGTTLHLASRQTTPEPTA